MALSKDDRRNLKKFRKLKKEKCKVEKKNVRLEIELDIIHEDPDHCLDGEWDDFATKTMVSKPKKSNKYARKSRQSNPRGQVRYVGR